MSKIHLISGPRNISTALMYSFGNRADMSIVDEPFYAYYLHQHPELVHPGREEILASMSTDYKEVLETIIDFDYPTDHVFFKNMAHHLYASDWSFIKDLKNIFLIRNPAQLIASFAQVMPKPTMQDIGLKLEWALYEEAQKLGATSIVLDSNALLDQPQKTLTLLCQLLEIPFSDEMLAWEPGPREADGVWAQYWYTNVHKSTGFKTQATSVRPFPKHLKGLLKEATVYYEKLLEQALLVV